MSGLHNILLRSKKGGAAPPPPGTYLWSELFASATTGDNITIPVDTTVLFDLTQSPIYRDVLVLGTMDVDVSKNTEFRAESLVFDGGRHLIGRDTVPLQDPLKHRITLTGAYSRETAENKADMKNALMTSIRGILYMNGFERSWFGHVPADVHVKLGATAEVGATTIQLSKPVTWKAGKTIHLATTRYWAEAAGAGAEFRVIAADVVNSTTVTLTQPLTYRHFGQLQYMVPPAFEGASGVNLSLTPRVVQPGDVFAGNVPASIVLNNGAPQVRDTRCTVSYVDFPIRISSPADSDYTTHGWAATIGMMGYTGTCRVRGVTWERAGKAGMLGAYPDHHHMRSGGRFGQPDAAVIYGPLNPATNYHRGIAVLRSTNRGFVFHGTQGASLEDAFFDDIDTHAVFQEDGGEEEIIIRRCHVARVNPIGYGKTPIKEFDARQYLYQGPVGPSGFWLVNLRITFEDNEASGGDIGIWQLPSTKCFGQSRMWPIVPNRRPVISWARNEAHSQRRTCMITGSEIVNEAGALVNPGYGNTWRMPPQIDLQTLTDAEFALGLMLGANLWKGHHQCYVNNAMPVNYDSWQVGPARAPFTHDGVGGEDGDENQMIRGVAAGQFIRCLFTPKSLDDAYPLHKPYIAVSYHGGVWWKKCNVLATPINGLVYFAHGILVQRGGMMRLSDFYEDPIYTGFKEWDGTAIIGQNGGYPGYFSPPLQMIGRWPSAAQYMGTLPVYWNQSQVGAKRIPAGGTFFNTDGGWWVHNDPFFLFGLTGYVNAATPPGTDPGTNGVLMSVAHEWYGLEAPYVDFVDVKYAGAEVHFDRVNPATDAVVSSWDFPYSDPNQTTFHNMRRCSIIKGGHYRVRWNQSGPAAVPLPLRQVQLLMFGDADQITTTGGHHFYVEVQFSGAKTVSRVLFPYTGGGGTIATQLGSKQAVRDQQGFAWWQDKPNNRVVVCVAWGQFGRDLSHGPYHVLALYSRLHMNIEAP